MLLLRTSIKLLLLLLLDVVFFNAGDVARPDAGDEPRTVEVVCLAVVAMTHDHRRIPLRAQKYSLRTRAQIAARQNER